MVLRALFLSIAALSIVLGGCASRARKAEKQIPRPNLLAINPRPPLDPVEAKRYHDLVEDFIINVLLGFLHQFKVAFAHYQRVIASFNNM